MMMGFELVILAVIAVIAVQAMRGSALFAGARPASGPSAKETLDARLARGEVSVDEYRKLLETIEAR